MHTITMLRAMPIAAKILLNLLSFLLTIKYLIMIMVEGMSAKITATNGGNEKTAAKIADATAPIPLIII
jgi:hypothetical protein